MSDGDNREPTSGTGWSVAGLQSFGPILLAIILVLGIVAGLFENHRRTRLRDLEELYARHVAHVARHAELRLQNFEAVIGNLRPDAQKQSLDAQALVRELVARNRLAAADDALQFAHEHKQGLAARADALNKRTQAFEAVVVFHETEALLTTAELTRERQRVGEAIAKADSARKTEEEKRKQHATEATKAQVATDSAHRAAQVADESATELRALEALALVNVQKQVDEPAVDGDASRDGTSSNTPNDGTNPAPSPNPATASSGAQVSNAAAQNPSLQAPPPTTQQAGRAAEGESAPAPAPIDAARAKADQAQRTAVEAAQAAANASAKAAASLREAEEASELVRTRSEEVVGALNHYMDRLGKAEGASREFRRVEHQYKQLLKSLRSANDALKTSSTAVERLRESLGASLTQAAQARAESDALLSRAVSGALPSYLEELQQCLRPDRVEDQGTCLMQATAQMKGLDPSQFRFVPCTAPIAQGRASNVWLSEDRRNLIYPLEQKLGETSGCVQISVSELMSLTMEDQPGAGGERRPLILDEVMLIGPDGSVLHASTTSPIRIDRLPNFEPKDPSASHMARDVELGAAKYRAFLQPVQGRIALPCSDGEKCDGALAADRASGLMVVGFVDEERLSFDSMRLRPASFLYVALVLGLILVGLPLTKLFLMREHSRYTRFDGALLAAGAGMATLLVTVAAWSLFAHERLERRLDRQLTLANERLSGELGRQLSETARTLEAMTNETGDLTRALAQQKTEPGASRAKLIEACKRARPENRDGLTSWVGFEATSTAWAVCERVDYAKAGGPEWRQFVFSNEHGFQLAKFAWDKHATAPIDVSHRDYFRQALRGETGCLKPAQTSNTPVVIQSASTRAPLSCAAFAGVVEVVRAGTSGDIIIVMARPVYADDKNTVPIGVATLSTSPRWLGEQVLPRGMQFAVVDARGRVALHSNSDARHGHKIIDDVDDPQVLSALLASRVTRHVDLNYHGEPVRMEARYLSGPEWHVLTFTPRSQVDDALVDTVVLALTGLGCYLLATLLLLIVYIVSKLRNHHRAEKRSQCVWFRPESGLAARYRTVGVVVLALGVAAVLLDMALPLMVTLTVLLAATIVALWRPELGKWWAPKRFSLPAWLQGIAVSYTIWLFSVVVVVVLLPASVWLVESYQHVAANLVRADLVHYERALRHAPACLANLDKCTKISVPSELALRLDAARAPTVRVSASQTQGDRAPKPVAASIIPQSQQVAALDPSSRSGVGPCLLGPVPCLVGLVHWVGLQQFAGCLLHESSGSPANECDACTLQLHQHAVGMAVLGTERFICGKLPNLLEFTQRGLPWALGALGLLLVVVLGFLVAHASCKRAFFMHVLQDFARPPDERALVETYGRVLLKGAGTQPSWAVDFSKYGTPGANPRQLPYFIADIHETLAVYASRQRLLKMLRDEAKPKILAFAPTSPKAEAKENEETRRQRLAVLGQFREELGRVNEDVFLNNTDKPTDTYLRFLWEQLPPDQQRVLGQLAIHGFVTPSHANEDALERLALRGILCAQTLTVQNRAFVRFIRDRVSDGDLSKGEATSGPWEKLRAPLYTAVAATCVAVGFSAPEVAMTGALAPALAAGLPAFLRVVGSIPFSR